MTEYNKIKYDNQECAVEYAVNAGTQNSATSQTTQTTQGTCSGNQATATKLQTARNINIQDADGTNTGTAQSFNGTQAATIKLPQTIKASITGNCSGSSGSCTGNQATQTKLATARTFRTNLGSTSTASFDGSGNVTPGVTGTLAVGNGGTGNTSVDTQPTSGSTKMCTSGGILTQINNQKYKQLFHWSGSIFGAGSSATISYGSTVYNVRNDALICFAFKNSSNATKMWFTAPYICGDSLFTMVDTVRYWANNTPDLMAIDVNWGTGSQANQTVKLVGAKKCYITSDGNTNWADQNWVGLCEIYIYGRSA